MGASRQVVHFISHKCSWIFCWTLFYQQKVSPSLMENKIRSIENKDKANGNEALGTAQWLLPHVRVKWLYICIGHMYTSIWTFWAQPISKMHFSFKQLSILDIPSQDQALLCVIRNISQSMKRISNLMISTLRCWKQHQSYFPQMTYREAKKMMIFVARFTC